MKGWLLFAGFTCNLINYAPELSLADPESEYHPLLPTRQPFLLCLNSLENP